MAARHFQIKQQWKPLFEVNLTLNWNNTNNFFLKFEIKSRFLGNWVPWGWIELETFFWFEPMLSTSWFLVCLFFENALWLRPKSRVQLQSFKSSIERISKSIGHYLQTHDTFVTNSAWYMYNGRTSLILICDSFLASWDSS